MPKLRATEFCKKCKVIQGCLDYALRFEPLGIWGGTNEVEREEFIKNQGYAMIRYNPNEAVFDLSDVLNRINRRLMMLL